MFTIRPATSNDDTALQAIYALSIAEATWLPVAAKQSPIFADVSHGEMVYLAATEVGVVLGFVSVQIADPFIHHLYVHPDARGMSIGSALLDSLQTWLPQPWRLKCVSQNFGALRFYRRGGWQELGSGESEHGSFILLSFDQSNNPRI